MVSNTIQQFITLNTSLDQQVTLTKTFIELIFDEFDTGQMSEDELITLLNTLIDVSHLHELPMHVKYVLASRKFFLEDLTKDENAQVRAKVASHGEHLENFVNDYSWIVRLEVARHGQFLNVLRNDSNMFVREEVQRQIMKKGR